MKTSSVFATLLAAVVLCSCSALSGSQSTNTSATPAVASSLNPTDAVSSGQTAGLALDQLYNSYKAAGKLDMSNLQNIINLAQLVNSCQQLKTNKSDKSYLTSFAKGLVVGSLNITQNNSANVTNQLANLMSTSNTASLSSALTSALGQATQTASSAAASSLTEAIVKAQNSQAVQNAANTVSSAATTASSVASHASSVASSISQAASGVTSILSLFGK